MSNFYATVAGAGDNAGTEWAKAFAIADLETFLEDTVNAGDIIFVAGGTYSSGGMTSTRAGAVGDYIEIIGVKAATTAEPPTSSDWAYGTDRPVIAMGANNWHADSWWLQRNITWTGTANPHVTTDHYPQFVNCKVTNTGGGNITALGVLGAYGRVDSCEVIGPTATPSNGIEMAIGGMVINSYIHDGIRGITISAGAPLIVTGSVIANHETGIYIVNHGCYFGGNVLYGHTTSGISFSGKFGSVCVNNIFDSNAIGANASNADQSNYCDYNFWNNTTDRTNITKGPNGQDVDPLLVDPANGDFRLQKGSPALGILSGDPGLGYDNYPTIGHWQEKSIGITTDSSIEAALYSLMSNDATLTAIVSTRIYINLALQGAAVPHVTYQQLSGLRDEVMIGPSGLVESRFQINIWGDTYTENRSIANAVRGLLDGYSGTVGTVEIEAIHMIDESDVPQFPAGKDVIKRYGKRLDFTVWFKE